MQANPLEGSSEIDRKSTGIDKYFLKVVSLGLGLQDCSAQVPLRLRPMHRPPLAGSLFKAVQHHACYILNQPPHLFWFTPTWQVPTDYYTLWGRKTHTYQ